MTNAPPHPWPSLQSAVRRAGTNYTALAEQLGLSRQAVSAYANGDRRPSAATIAAIAHILGVPVEELRADVPFATSSPREMLDEIDGLVSVLDTRLKNATSALEQMKAKRQQLEQLVQVPA